MRVKVIGASSPFPAERLAAGVKVLRAHGFDVDDADALQGSHAYLNGDDATRIALLDSALASGEHGVDVVWLARGGYGLTRIASRLTIPRRIPLVVGFSDATALFARLHREGLAHRAVHGPLATSIAHEGKDTVDHLVDLLAGGAGHALPALRVLTTTTTTTCIEGPLFAGNLCVLAALCGTPLQPDLRGHLVAIEEVGERPYRLDRMLTQLIDAGCFKGVVGFVVGHLTGCEEPANPATSSASPRDAAPTALEVVVERLATVGVPVVAGLPFGHEAPNWALPLARKAVLDVKPEGATLRLSRMSIP